MAATPDEFLRDGGFLIEPEPEPEPLSPSLFLDLPATPPTAAADDLDISYISRMLMEDDIDDKFFYHYPALLSAQQPYAQIISDASGATNSTSADSAATTTTTSSNGNHPTPSSSDDTNNDSTTWPYDPIELSQLLRSPPYLDMRISTDSDLLAYYANDLFLPGDGAGSKLSPPVSKRVDDNFFFTAAGSGGQNGGSTGIQSSAVLNGLMAEEARPATFPAADDGQDALTSPFFSGQTNGEMDMLSMAFRKGMEEANKFLPTNNALSQAISDKPVMRSFTADGAKEKVDGFGTSMFGNRRGRKNRHEADDLEAETGRNSKLMAPEQGEMGAREMVNEIMLHDYEICMKGMEELRVAMNSEAEKNIRKGTGKAARGRRGGSDTVDLRTMLIHCAQAVATGDRRSASELLRQIKQHSSPRGDATQRLAYCFAEGLEARLAGMGSQVYQSLMAKRTSVIEYLKAYKLYMAASSFKKVHMTFCGKTIIDAMVGKNRLHIVDYNVQFGFQWPGLLKELAIREGGPPEVRITGIDLPEPGFRPAYQVEETGRRLSSCAHEFGLPFKFHSIAAKWETVRVEDLNIDPEEVLIVTSQCSFDNLMDESVIVDSPSPRDVVLSNIRRMKPEVFIECTVNGNYGAPFFVTRFREALFFYSAQFDMLDATIPRDNDDRLIIERDILGRCALNVIACEGADRIDRPETYKQWQVRSHRAGLRQLPLNPEVVKLVKDKVKNCYHKDFVIDVDNGWLMQGWKGRVLYAMSTWVAEDDNSKA